MGMPLLKLYEKLRNLEIHLDRAILKKRLLNEESHHKRIKCTKRLRVFLKYEKFEDSYHLQIDGRVVNDLTGSTTLKTTDLLKSIVVKLNHNSENTIFEWSKSTNDMIDCFELSGTEKHDSITLVLEFENT